MTELAKIKHPLVPLINLIVLTHPRLVLLICSFLFTLAINHAHAVYLSQVHEIYGFSYQPLDLSKWLFLVGSISLATASMPLSLRRPSGVILFVLYLLVYLPTLIITLATKIDSIHTYGSHLAALVFGFSIICVFTRLFNQNNKNIFSPTAIKISIRLFFLIAWVGLAVFLVFSFHEIIRFVGLEDTYAQRIAGRGRNLLENYAQTYFGFVFSPALLAIGLIIRKHFYIVLSFIGYAILYSITAERTFVLMPITMILLYFALRSNIRPSSLMGLALIMLSIIIYLSVTFENANYFFELISLYLVFRTIAVPGSMLSLYHDVFFCNGFTYWSNVRGVNIFIDTPSSYLGDINWPQLGYIVADYILGLESNSNANLFAYDGVAAAGSIGILVICSILCLWLIILDWTTKRINFLFSFLVLFPIAIALTNGSLFSVLLSFGGFFWPIVFFIISFQDKFTFKLRNRLKGLEKINVETK